MNVYTLNAESRRWWWPSAAAGAVGTAAVAAILMVPTTGHAMPVEDFRNEAPATVFGDLSIVEPGTGTGHPCFMIRANWNVALDGTQPVCGLRTAPERSERSGVVRPGLDFGP